MTPVKKLSEVWQTLPWKKLQRNVFRLQKRIYQAKRRNDVRTVRNLQRLPNQNIFITKTEISINKIPLKKLSITMLTGLLEFTIKSARSPGLMVRKLSE